MAKTESSPAVWTDMILCGLATFFPLLIGLVCHQMIVSIYGALCGYLLALNVPPASGRIGQRMVVISFTAAILVIGFAFGFIMQDHITLYALALAGSTYALGLLANEGAEFERGLLFSVIAMVVGNAAKGLPTGLAPSLFFYVFIGFATLMIGNPLIVFKKSRQEVSYPSLWESFQKIFVRTHSKHAYAAIYSVMTLTSVWLYSHFQVERGYWTTVTILLVTRPDRTQALYRIFQRLVGTFFAVLLMDLIMPQIQAFELLILFAILISAGSVPWALKRNYWLVTFFATLLVILLLELAAPDQMDMRTPYLRLRATALGCILSAFGVCISKLLEVLVFQPVTGLKHPHNN